MKKQVRKKDDSRRVSDGDVRGSNPCDSLGCDTITERDIFQAVVELAAQSILRRNLKGETMSWSAEHAAHYVRAIAKAVKESSDD